MAFHRSSKFPHLPMLFAVPLSLGLGLIMTPSAQGNDSDIPEIQWDTKVEKFQFDTEKFIGQRLTVRCPPASANQEIAKVYGTSVYPSNTPICAAALHAGVIGREGGTVTLQLNPGAEEYVGSLQNGIESGNLPATKRSIVFIGDANVKSADEIHLKHLPRIDWDAKFTRTGFAYRHLVGQRISFRCPPAPSNLRPRLVYGTDDYAFASMICRAAVHADKLSPESGGVVTVQINPGVDQLVGSIRNGIETKGKRGSDRSIRFVDNPVED